MTAPIEAPALDVLVEHARRGVRLQMLLRAVLAAFFVLTVVAVPAGGRATAAQLLIVAGYIIWVGGFFAWFRGGGTTAVGLAWLAQFVDLAVLTALSLLAGLLTPQSWSADVLAAGFGLVPVLAATQLRPRVCAAVVVPTVLLSFLVGVATQTANEEPWSSLLLRTLLLAGVGLGCIGLSRIQRSRVDTIIGLLGMRSQLLAELGEIEGRERRVLAESLHDGALQYVLAARQDLEDARDTGDPGAFDRVGEALAESSVLLRSTVSQLHPAVLERAGLPAALRDLARTTGARGGFTAQVQIDGWPDERRTAADALLYRTARELLGNVAAHAAARHARVVLDGSGDPLRLTVADDGVGIAEGVLEHRLADGHIGLPSHALRVEAAGGSFRVVPGAAGGTVATVELPSPDGGTARSAGASADDPTVRAAPPRDRLVTGPTGPRIPGGTP